MNTKLHVGVVGSGIGQQHIQAYQTLPEQFEVRAICDVDEAKAQELATTYNIPHVVTDLTSLCQMEIDALQFDQPDLHELDTLASHQTLGKITFWCPVDIQKTLQQRDENVIRTKAKEMLDKLWKGQAASLQDTIVTMPLSALTRNGRIMPVTNF